MYRSNQEMAEIAKTSWKTAQERLDKLGKEMNKLERKAERCGYSVEYTILCEDIEAIRLMYAALAPEVAKRWNMYQKTLESA